MGATTGIAWCDATWNPVSGCTKVSAGCKHCYAERLTQRFGGTFTDVKCHPDRLTIPLHWRKGRRIFTVSMGDLFHEAVPDEFIDRVFAIMALAPRHTFQILTKRPERMVSYFHRWEAQSDPTVLGDSHLGCILNGPVEWMMNEAPEKPGGNDRWYWIPDQIEGEGVVTAAGYWDYKGKECPVIPWPLPNVWLGVSCEDQATADARIPLLLQTPAAVRFVSYEPALEEVDFTGWLWGREIPCPDCPKDADCECGYEPRIKLAGEAHIDWLIAGGESGPKARPCDIRWIRSAMCQCQAADTPVFVKQLGANIAGRDCEHGRSGKTCKTMHRSGADPSEWPEDLRVREFPC